MREPFTFRDGSATLARMSLGWDTRVVWLDERRTWWWNAWHEPTARELYGVADSDTEARQAMNAAIAIANAGQPAQLDGQRDQQASGAA